MRLRVGLILLLVLNLAAATAVFSPATFNQLSTVGSAAKIDVLGSLPSSIGATVTCDQTTTACQQTQSMVERVVQRWTSDLNAFGARYGFSKLANIRSSGLTGPVHIRLGGTNCNSGEGADTSVGSRTITLCTCSAEPCVMHEFGHALGLGHIANAPIPYEIMVACCVIFKSRPTTLDMYALATGQGSLPSNIPYVYMEDDYGNTIPIPEFSSVLIVLPLILVLATLMLRRQKQRIKQN